MKKECLILGGLVPDVYYSVSRWPDRGQDGFISDETWWWAAVRSIWHGHRGKSGPASSRGSPVWGEDEIGGRMDDYQKEHGLSGD